MSPWPHISACPQLLDGRRGRAIRPSRAEPHLHSLDVPTRRLDKQLRRCTLWLCSSSSRPRYLPVRKPVWMPVWTLRFHQAACLDQLWRATYHVTYLVLAEAEGSIRGLASRTPSRNGDSGLCISPSPMERPLAKARRDHRHGAQKEGCHDRRFQQGLGSAVRRLTDLRSLVRGGVGPAHQLPRNTSSVPDLSIRLAGHTGTPYASRLRQQVLGVRHKSTGQPCLDATLHTGEWPSCVGSDQSVLTEDDACAGQDEPWSRHVVTEQRLLRGMDAPPACGSENLGGLWQSSSRPLRLRRELSLPNLFHKEHGCPGPRVAQSSALCFPSNRSTTAGTQASQGATAQAYSNSPPLEEPAVGVGVIPAAATFLFLFSIFLFFVAMGYH